MSDIKKNQVERKSYTVLTGNHSHQGKSVKKGSKIDLTVDQAEWLKKKGVV